MDIDMHHGHGHVAWTWSCKMNTDLQNRHGHPVCICTRSMDLDKQLGLGHAECIFPCCMDMGKYMLHVQVHVQAACLSKLHVHIHSAFHSTCWVSMFMLHANVYCALCMCPCSMLITLDHVHASAPCLSTYVQHGHGHSV